MSEDIVGVEQADRDMAAEYAMRFLRWNRDVVDAMDEGRADEDTLIQAFARHRIAATLTPEPSAAVDLEGGVTFAQRVSRICTNERDRWWNSLTDAQRIGLKRGSLSMLDWAFRAGVEAAIAAHTNRGEVERLREVGSVIESMARAVHASTGATMSWEDDADQEACVRAVVAMFKGAVPLPEHVVDNCEGLNADIQYDWRQIVAAILDEPKARAALSSPDTVKDVSATTPAAGQLDAETVERCAKVADKRRTEERAAGNLSKGHVAEDIAAAIRALLGASS